MPNSAKGKSIDYKLGQKLKDRRLQLRLNLDDIASSIGLTFQQVQKYEAGHNKMSASRLYQLSKLLGIDIAYFFQDLDDDGYKTLKVSENNDADPLYNEESMKLITAYWSMDEVSRKKFFELMLTMAKK